MMKKFLIFTAMAIILTTSAAGATIFSLDADIYKNDTVELNSFNITEGTPSNRIPGEYLVRTIDSEGNTLYSQNFSVRYSVVYDVAPNMTAPDSQTAKSRRKLLRIPYSYEAEKIQISKSGEQLYSLSIPERVCKSDSNCPDYCKGKGIDSDCESEDKNEGALSKILNTIFRIVPL